MTGDLRSGALGDFIRALGALEPQDGNARAALAAMFGFELRKNEAAKEKVEPELEDPQKLRIHPQYYKKPERPPPPEPYIWPKLPPIVPRLREPPTELKLTDPSPKTKHIKTTPHSFVMTWCYDGASLPTPPLFQPRLQSTLVKGLLSRRREGDDIDFERLIQHMTELRPIQQLPLRRAWRLAGDIDVLIDMGEHMRPFRNDQRSMITMLPKLVGRHRLRMASFRENPRYVRFDGTSGVSEYRPRPGASVLFLAAPGAGLAFHQDAIMEDWQSLLEQAGAAGCSAVILSPRRPKSGKVNGAALTSLAAIVHWDRATGTRAIQQARRSGRLT